MFHNDNILKLKRSTDDTKNNNFNPKIMVIVDPLTEPTKSEAPKLFILNDYFKAPLYFHISPALELNSEDMLPISSYDRFVVQCNKFFFHTGIFY